MAQKAMALRADARPRERAYIEAVAVRYTGRPEDRRDADRAFADAMRKLADDYPDDLDAATIFAEAMMDLRPWNYWTRDGRPYPETEEIAAVLQSVLARNPRHPGALHYWVHLWEPTHTPEKAEAEADRLLAAMPGAGHMVHMPGHIYARVGRYADVVKANRMAIAADEEYIAQCRAQGIYPLGYYPHNIHFLWLGATMGGQSRLALDSAEKTARVIPHHALTPMPFLQGFLAVPYWAKVRFGRWDEILAGKDPPHDTLFLRGVRQTLGAVLLTAGRPDEAEVVYWEDLKRNPENGWSLFGLMQALRIQGKSAEAADVEKRFHRAWADADVKLLSSRETARK